MKNMFYALILSLVLAISSPLIAANQGSVLAHWGYGYDSLLHDLAVWRANPNAKVESVGVTQRGRALWMVSISSAGDSLNLAGDSQKRKHRIFIHARTHPSEVQANFVANEAIRFLLRESQEATELRSEFLFNIIPMYNPDGVEEERPRENGNDVNLEVNWNVAQPELEVLALRKLFGFFMNGPTPIEVALNLHSDQYQFSRYFWFHEAGGTSLRYTELEKQYIGLVQSHFPGGVQNWDNKQSWSKEPGLVYPEGYWWKNYRESVMALTYEDTNSPTASKFDSTGRALILGSVDYIRSRKGTRLYPHAQKIVKGKFSSEGVEILELQSQVPASFRSWVVHDLTGRIKATGQLIPGEKILTWKALAKTWGGILTLYTSTSTTTEEWGKPNTSTQSRTQYSIRLPQRQP